MLDSIYQMTFKLIKNRIFGVKTSRFCHLLRNVMVVITSRLSILLHSVIAFPNATSCDKYIYFIIAASSKSDEGKIEYNEVLEERWCKWR